MKTLVIALSFALAAAGHALVIDDFSDGAVDSGRITGGAAYSSDTPASVPGGVRSISFDQTSTANSATGYQIAVNPGNAANSGLSLSLDPQVSGTLTLSYRIPDSGNNPPLDLSATPIVRVNVPFNDMTTAFDLSLTSIFGGPFTVQGFAGPSSGLDQFVDFDFSDLFATNPLVARSIVGVTFSTTTPTSNDFIVNSITTIPPVPEPASFAAVGLGALALMRRRRRI